MSKEELLEWKRRTLTKKELKKLSYGDEYVKIKIPKKTEVLIMTTISRAKNGGQNISTETYSVENLEKLEE